MEFSSPLEERSFIITIINVLSHSSEIQGVHSCSVEGVDTEGPKIRVEAFYKDGIHTL